MSTPVQYGSVQPVQFPLSTYCTGPCWAGGSGTVTVVNQDPQNYAYVGYTNSITPGGLNTAPLPPGGSMTFPGDRSIYAIGTTATMKPLLLMPGAIQYFAPQSVTSSLISTMVTGQTLSGGGNANSYGPYNVNQVGYEILFGAMKASGAGAQTNPFCLVQLVWSDSVTGVTLGSDTWTCPIAGAFAANGQFPIYGRGPTKGDQVTINIQNLDSVSMNYNVSLFQNARTYATDDWRWNNSILTLGGVTAPTGYTLGGIPYDESILGQSNLTVPATTGVVSRLFGMFNGPCNFDMAGSGPAASNVSVTLQQTPTTVYGNNKIFAANEAGTPTAYIGPRGPINITIANTGSTILTCTFTTIVQPI